MMQETVLYLSRNPEVFEKLEKGEVSLINTTSKQLKVIIKAFALKADPIDNDLWR